MFRAINSPILRSTFLTVCTAFGTMHRHCCQPVPRGTLQTCRADFKRLIKRLIMKKLLHLVGYLHHCTSDARSHRHQVHNRTISERSHIFIEAFCMFSIVYWKQMEIRNAFCLPIILVLNALATHSFTYLTFKANLFLSNWKFKILRESVFNEIPCIRLMSNASFRRTLIKVQFEIHVKYSTSFSKFLKLAVPRIT